MSHRYGAKFIDVEETCPYLPNRLAVLPFYLTDFRASPEAFDQALSEGVRRSGIFIYHTQCPGCNACEPIRIPVEDFEPRRRHRRVLKKAEVELRVEIGEPIIDRQRVELYNKHKVGRGLGEPGSEVDLRSLKEFIGITCCDSREFRYFLGDKLVGIAIADVGQEAMSAVYCYFDSELPDLGIGNFSVLKQIEACRAWGLKYLYLGFYVAGNAHMQYKASYLPHERRIDGVWQRFE
ncbi:arginyltransferase [Blastopirellula marina]|uniref:Arginyltransferase n=1 Tax=Blastopirellula marina TaxID=124 RepID=A0A2S8F7B5_9BACT|nr:MULTISPECIES: arginyltransferase [Pirellulaceae]PQO28043.1 arginyltransferase [Blastopirellula marina]RCS48468.1 arginyltransferase [Bremerella cremea]